VDILKIDRSFTEGLLRGDQDVAFVRTIVSLAEVLEVRTIAEGVEHWEQFEELASLGCDAVQGFLFQSAASARRHGGTARLRCRPAPIRQRRLKTDPSLTAPDPTSRRVTNGTSDARF
jgi:EAL domain-containing protein (putative c-di-GMP-specific phosphodiesterase class I)